MVVRQTVDAHAVLPACHRLPFDNLMNEDCVLLFAESVYTSTVFKDLLYRSKLFVSYNRCLTPSGCKNLRLYGQASRAISTG
jgi:hypothetical protein